MKIKNLIITFVSAIALLVSTSTISFAKVVGDKIILGAAVSLTGKYSSNGVHTKNGYNLAVDRWYDAKDENVLIQKYREMSMTQEVDLAISDVVNESVVHEDGRPTINLFLDQTKQSTAIKEKIVTEFKAIMKLLDFNRVGSDLFRKWYVDGKIYHHIIVDIKKPKEGIKELIPVDALSIQKITEITKDKEDEQLEIPSFLRNEEEDHDKKEKSSTSYCSFCGKSQHEVLKLIAGPKVCICDECVDLCVEIIKEEKRNENIKKS